MLIIRPSLLASWNGAQQHSRTPSFPAPGYSPPNDLQRAAKERSLLEQYYENGRLEQLSPDQLRKLHFRLTSNPLTLCLGSMFGLPALGHSLYLRAVQLYCPSRARFTEENCAFGRSLITELNDFYQDGYVPRFSDLRFSNPAEAMLARHLLEEMGFEQCDELGRLMWDYRLRCQEFLARAMAGLARSGTPVGSPGSPAPDLRPIDGIDSRKLARLAGMLNSSGVQAIGLERRDARSLGPLEQALRCALEQQWTGRRSWFALGSHSEMIWPQVEDRLRGSDALVVERVELFSVFNLVQLLHSAQSAGVKLIVLVCDLESDSEIAALLRRPSTLHLSPVQPSAGWIYHEPEGSRAELDSLCYADPRYYSRASGVTLLRSLDELEAGHAVNWIGVSALPAILRCYIIGEWNALRQPRRRIQLCTESSLDQRAILRLIEEDEMLGCLCYPGMKMRQSNSFARPPEQRTLDPLKALFICERVSAGGHGDGDDSVTLGFSTPASLLRPDHSQPDFYCTLADACQEEVLPLEELSRTDNDLLIYFSSEPVTHRQLRRLVRLTRRQVLIVAEPRNMRQLHSGL